MRAADADDRPSWATTSTRTPARGRSARARPDGRLRPRRRQRSQRLGAAVALLRASRLERARRRPSRPRQVGRRRAAVGRGDRGLDLRAARRGRHRRARRSSAIRWDRWRRWNARRAFRSGWRSSRSLGPAAPMPVSEVLQDAAKRDDHVALELITGWSYSAGKQLGGNRVPGPVAHRQRAAPPRAHEAGRAPRRSRRLRPLRRRRRQRGRACAARRS